MEEGEIWAELADFPGHQISNWGRVFSRKLDRVLRNSSTRDGDVKISLQGLDGRRTVSVKYLVAKEFVYKPGDLFDSVINLDANPGNIDAMNLAWRPKWFAWQYVRQFKTERYNYFEDIPVLNEQTEIRYTSLIECAMAEGVLLRDLWRSMCEGNKVFPTGYTYCFTEYYDE